MIPIKCRIKKALRLGYPLPNTYCKWRMSCKNRARCFNCENFYTSIYFSLEYGKAAAEGFKKGFETIGAKSRQMCDAFINLAIAIQKAKEFLNDTYPNRRVVHLAKNHKSPRVRKKNQKRIEKYFEKKVAK